MNKSTNFSIFLSRVVLGWFFFYAGITKVLDPTWSAGGYLQGAKTFPGFYHWLLSPNILPTINILNEWGLTLIGIALIFGIFVRLSSILGIVLMILYYLPILDFPHPDAHSYIVDQHIIYTVLLLVFVNLRAGRMWGIDKSLANSAFFSKHPMLRNLLS